MRAMILAAGLGTRLRPLTLKRPKCLMPVMNKPLLGLWLDQLASLGVEEALVNTHHLAAQVQDYLRRGPWGGLGVGVSHEPEILGTGGGLVQARAWLGEESFLLVNADVVPGLMLSPLMDKLKQSGALAVLGLVDAPRFNTVALDDQCRVRGFKGDANVDGRLLWRTYSGLAALDTRLLDYLPARGYSTLVQGLSKALAQGEMVLGQALPGFWDDLGTPESLLALHRALLGEPPPGLKHLAQPGPLVAAPGARVERGAVVEGFCVMGAGAVIKAGARVIDSLLLPSAVVEAGAVVAGAVLGDGFVARGHIRGGAHA
jgi:mannose-1-phosphate guanylyltransferase